MTEASDEEYKKAVNDFYQVYLPARKKYNLRMDSSFSVTDDGKIEIWRYEGERKAEKVCRIKVSEADDIVCYQKAKQEIEDYVRKKEEQEDGWNAANYA